MFTCKDCGRQVTDEQVLSATEQCKDVTAMLHGLTPWQCLHCRLQQTTKETVRGTPVQLAATDELVNELLGRFPHVIVAYRTIPIEGINRADEGYYHSGDYRMCQGIAVGMMQKLERSIMQACARRAEAERQNEEGE